MGDQDNQKILALDNQYLTSDLGVKDFKVKLEKLDVKNEFLNESNDLDKKDRLNDEQNVNDEITESNGQSTIIKDESNLNETINESNLTNEIKDDKEANQDVKEEAKQDADQDTNQDANQDANQNANQDANQDANQGVKEEEDDGPKEYCEDHVNFAIICSFFQHFGTQIGINYSIENLKEMLENRKKIEVNLIELHVKLLRKMKKYVNKERWESGLVKFVNEFSYEEAYELESTGYQKMNLKFKIDLLKRLLEAQFDFNQKFKSEINNIETLLLRLVPIGRDLNGNQYWYHLDEEHTLRIYREKPNKEKDWKLICEDKDQFTQLIDEVENGKTEICDLAGELTLSETSDQEIVEPQTTTKSGKKKSKKGKGKSTSNKMVNGYKEEVLSNSKNKDLVVNKLEVIKEENIEKVQSIVKEEKPRRGRRPLNRSLFTTPIKEEDSLKIKDNLIDQHASRPISEPVLGHTNLNENIDEIVKQTLSTILDQIENNLTQIESSTKDNQSIQNDNKNKLDNKSNDKEEPPSSATKSKGRRKKNPLGELSKLLGDNAPKSTKNLEELMPVKRSSRIQKLQEKKTAELKMQMEIEQKKLEDAKKFRELKKKEAEEKKLKEVDDDVDYNKSEEIEDDSDEEYKEPVKSRKKNNETSDSEVEFSTSKKKKKGRKNKKERDNKDKKLNKLKKWSSNDDLEDFYQYEEEEEVLKFDDNNDEFACEELEEDDEPIVLKRARTARKAKTDDNNELDECINDDTPCQKCNLFSDPEWILLCDNCNLGYHTKCLIPKLYLIPDGDWYCPKCENEQLLTKLKFEFENYVSNLAKREREKLRKERLKHVEINIENILTEESGSRNRKSAKKKYNVYDSDLDDSDLIDESDESRDVDNNSSNYNSDDSSTNAYRKRYSSNRRTNNKSYSKRSRPVQRVNKPRPRRRSYSDQSGSDETSNSELSSQKTNDSQSDSDSEPKQRSARKKVSYQFKEYDDLINSAIQVSDYDDEYDEEELEEEEEESDDGKSPYSKGKDISNLISLGKATNPFQTDDDVKPNENSELIVNNVSVDNKLTEQQINLDEKNKNLEDERKVVPEDNETKKKGKQKSKRKLNDLDSPVEEAENDSDFTIKDDESATELDELESNDYSNETDLSEDDTDLSDWARNTRKRSTRSTRSGGSKRKHKKRRRYDSDEDSEYGYKTRRKSKRVTYRELSTTEEEDEEADYDDWSDNSEKYKKNKKNKKKKKLSDSELSDEMTGSEDERAVVKKKKSNKKSKRDYTSEELESEEEGKRKSKRTQSKKVYDDFTDIESETEEPQQETTEVAADEKQQETNDTTITVDQQQFQQEQQQQQINEPMMVVEQQQFIPPDLHTKDQAVVAKRAPKIKITKPNPKLAKNKNLNLEQASIDLPPTAIVPVDQINLPNIDLNNPNMPLGITEQMNQSVNNSLELSIDNSMEKKKRGRKPKDPSKEVKDSNAPPSKRGRKPKSNALPNDQIQPDHLQNPVNLPSVSSANANSALSQLTQFALDSSNKLLPNSNPLAHPANMKQHIDMARQLLAAELVNKNLPILNSNLQPESKDKSTPEKAATSKTSSSKHNQNKLASSSTIQSVPTTVGASATAATKPSLNNSTHLLQNNSIPANNPIHSFPPTQPPNIHNPVAIAAAAQHSNRQAIPNHPAVSFPNLQAPPHPSIHSQSQLPPGYGLHGQNLHNLHGLHNPYAYQPPSHPSSTHHQLPPHLQGHLPPSHPSHAYPPNLHPQIASQLAATTAGFGYPPSSFYDPSFAYFGHPNQYHPYYNSHHPPQVPPHHPQAASTALHPSHHLQTTTSASATTATAKTINPSITQPNTTQSNTTTNTKSNSNSTPTSQ